MAFDTSVFIYHYEANPRYVHLTDEVFSWLAQDDSRATTSTITMTELMVQPYRGGGSNRLEARAVDEYYAIVSTIPHLEWIPVDLEIADLAAQFRAQHGLKTPDAIQAASAVNRRATALVTNDPVLGRVDRFETLVLDRFL